MASDDQAHGVVLRARPYSDTSLIVHWLTREHGRIATMARAARRAKSPFRGRLDLFYACELSFVRSRRSDLHTLREVRLVDAHARLRENLGWVQQASYAAALLEQVTETDTPVPELAALFGALLELLPTRAPQARTVYAFELKLLRELGLEPGSGGREDGVGVEWARKLADTPWEGLSALQVGTSEARALRTFLNGFLVNQFGKLARGRAEAIEAGRMDRGTSRAAAPCPAEVTFHSPLTPESR